MAYTTINKGSSYFNILLWSGSSNSSARSFTGVGFKPDWVWQKVRTTTYGHEIFDIIRTTNRLASNTTNAETALDQYGYISTFDTDGFTATPGSTDNTGWNEVGQTYVAWNWLGANTTVSNTQGTITSTVSANTTAGFSIVSYTGNGSGAATVGHGLSVQPKIVIVKSRSGGGNWMMYNGSGALNSNQNLALNSTVAADGTSLFSDGIINPSSVTSSVFGFTAGASGLSGVNGNTVTYIAYCFNNVKGYSKFGYYTGNGSADGPFVYTGFKPAWIMVKETGNVNSWRILDNKRSPFNVMNEPLFANLANAEGTSAHDTDFLSNGFKIRINDTNMNRSGGTFIYMCFAENPFVTSGGIPVTAR